MLLVAVGDGLTPRTAALFAFRTQWSCVAIDPLMAEADSWSGKVDRLRAVRARVQDAGTFDAAKVLLVLPHAHVELAACLRQVSWRDALAAIVIPCCNWYKAAAGCAAPCHEAEDLGIVSPHRLVRVWRWTRDDQCLPCDVPPAEPLIDVGGNGSVAEAYAAA